MPRSEIAQAQMVVAAVTDMLELAQEADDDEVTFRTYADEEAFRIAHPQPGYLDSALHARIIRTCARAAHRLGYDIAVLRLRAAPMRAWLAGQVDGNPEAYPGEPGDRLSGEAALRALGLSAAELKLAPRKPAQGGTLAARIARWATDPDADEGLIDALTEELLSQRLDGALGVVEKMLEPEDYAYARHEIDNVASTCVLGEAGRERPAVLFVAPVLREGGDPLAPDIPAGLQARLNAIALEPSFTELLLAPFWIPTAALARLRPSDLREAAEALANGTEPPIPRASPTDRDLCLLGLTLPDVADESDDEEAEDRLDAWLAAVAEASGGGQAEPPLPIGRALDLLRRVKLALPDEPALEEDESDDEESEDVEAMLDALLAHLAGIGHGSALLTGSGGNALAFRIADGEPDIEPARLQEALADALVDGGALFIVPAAGPGANARGHAFLLGGGEAEGLSATAAAEIFGEEAPEGWPAAPAAWVDAPALEYDPEPG